MKHLMLDDGNIIDFEALPNHDACMIGYEDVLALVADYDNRKEAAMKKEVEIKLTPQEMALEFTEWSDDNQAEFFSHCGSYMAAWGPMGRQAQMQNVGKKLMGDRRARGMIEDIDDGFGDEALAKETSCNTYAEKMEAYKRDKLYGIERREGEQEPALPGLKMKKVATVTREMLPDGSLMNRVVCKAEMVHDMIEEGLIGATQAADMMAIPGLKDSVQKNLGLIANPRWLIPAGAKIERVDPPKGVDAARFDTDFAEIVKRQTKEVMENILLYGVSPPQLMASIVDDNYEFRYSNLISTTAACDVIHNISTDATKNPPPVACKSCDCGAAKAKTTHSDWCSSHQGGPLAV